MLLQGAAAPQEETACAAKTAYYSMAHHFSIAAARMRDRK